MNKEKTYKGILSVLRWAARIIAACFVVLFLVFFIGEGGLGEFMYVNGAEKLRLTFLPVVFTIGLVIAWKRERLGGTIMVLSVIGFNLVRMIFKQELSGGFEFAFLLIPGLVLALLPYLSRKSNGK